MAPTPASISSIEPILKTIYDKQAKVIAFDSHPFLGRVPKNETFFGDNFVQTVRFVGGQGISANFTSALNNRTPNAYRKFTITRFSAYGVGSITGEAIEAAQGSMYTMAEGLESEIKGLFTSIGINAAASLYRSGSGTIGRGAALLTAATLQLATPSDAIHFGVGATLGSSPTDGSGAQNVGTVQITAIDMEAGTITVTPNWTVGIAGFAATDYLFLDGNYNAEMPGLLKWIPPVAPTAGDSLYGVDRSVAPVELAGMRINGGGAPREETWQRAMGLASRFGARIDEGYMHPEDLAKLTISLGSQVRRETLPATVTSVGYEAVEVSGPTGTVKIFGDPDCPEGYAWGIKKSTWELRTLKAMPRFLDLDGNRILREASADAYEFRIGYRGAVRCDSPKDNICITW
jgi:hypothetical protein